MGERDKEECHRVALFDGANFPAWKFRMLTLLDEHDLVQCVETEIGDVPEFKVEDGDAAAVVQQKEKARKDRAKKDKKCKTLIVSRIHDDQLEHLQGRDSPKQMWDSLVSVFERKSVAKRLHLNRQLTKLQYTGGSLQEHFVQFDRLIRLFRGAGGMMDNIDVVCRLLLSLDDTEYGTVVTSIESQPEERLTMDFVKSRLLDEEIKRRSTVSVASGLKNESAAFAGTGKKQVKKKKKIFKCFGCQKEGHKLAECPEKKNKSDVKRFAKPSAHVASDRKDGLLFLSDGGVNLNEQNKIRWYIDSGATEHICNDERLFDKLVPMAQPMDIAVAKSGEWVTAKLAGDVSVISVLEDESIEAKVMDVVYIPEARANLFSISKVESAGMRVVFEAGRVEILRDSVVVATGKRRDKLYELNFYTPKGMCDSLYFSGQINKANELWHRRFGHLGERNLNSLLSGELVNGMKAMQGEKQLAICESCVAAKQTRNPFALRQERRSSRVLELVHSDVCGPVTPVSWSGEKYFVTFIDDWSRFTVVYLIKTKDEVASCFQDYEAQATAKFGCKISRLRSDNGGEYIGKAMRSFCRQKGIKMDFTVPYSPEQNGVAERMNRTLVEKARSMLFDSGIDKSFWGEAMETAAYLANRSPTCAIDEKKTPAEIWNGKKPDVSKLKVFGSPAYCHIPKETRKKLDEKSWKGIFLGYGMNGYRVWNSKERRIVTVRDVIIDENAKMELCEPKQSKTTLIRAPCGSIADEGNQEELQSEGGDQNDSEPEDGAETENFDSCDDIMPENESDEADGTDSGGELSTVTRTRKPPAWQKDYDMTFAGFAFGAMEYVDNLPNTVADLKKRDDWPKWQAAIQTELDSLIRNNTWDLVKLPAGRNAVSCKWVFRIKPGNGGEPDKYKARLVARGFSQRYGYDYTETYSPVARVDTLRTLLAVANKERMQIHQMDVQSAFLNGDLAEVVYMTQPEGFEVGEGLVCHLKKSLYGLKQSSKVWNDRFDSFIIKLGFRRSENDPCLYIRNQSSKKLYLLLYVDDILIIGHDLGQIKAIKSRLSKEFKMTDLEEVSCFLGMKIQRDIDRRIMRISQCRYLENLLERFNMSECKPISIPMECRLRLQKGEESQRTSKPYRELVGCLMYVTLTTRPDLFAAVNYCSQFQSCPTEEHWAHLKRILRYVKGSLDFGLKFEADDAAPVLAAFCDADWANDVVDRRSVTGYVLKVFGCTAVWGTRKQQSVSLSSTEAELVALCAAVCEGLWLKRLIEELGYEIAAAVPYYEDNQSTIRIVREPKARSRLKHIDVKHQFVCDLVQQGQIELRYVSTEQQEADIMTKGLPAGQFRRLREKLNLTSIEQG